MTDDCWNCRRGCVSCGWGEAHEMCVQDCSRCAGSTSKELEALLEALQRGIEKRD